MIPNKVSAMLEVIVVPLIDTTCGVLELSSHISSNQLKCFVEVTCNL